MNVFKKISTSNLFHTEKKKTTIQIPDSAQKLYFQEENCYILIDYEIRDGLFICKISKDKTLLKSTNSKKLKQEAQECTVKELSEMKDLWIGKEYCFVNLSCLGISENQTTDTKSMKFAADKLMIVNEINRSKSKKN